MLPEHARDRQRIDLGLLPPRGFVTMPVQLSMVDTAHRDGELVADLAPKRAWLGKAQMVGVCGQTAAHQAGLGGDELAVVLVAQADGLGRYPASAGPGSYRKSFLGFCDCRIRVLRGLGGFGKLCLSQCGYSDAEAVLDELSVRDDQSVLGRETSIGSVRRADDPAAARIGRWPKWGAPSGQRRPGDGNCPMPRWDERARLRLAQPIRSADRTSFQDPLPDPVHRDRLHRRFRPV